MKTEHAISVASALFVTTALAHGAILQLRPGDTVLESPLKIGSKTEVRGHPRGSRLILKPGFTGPAAIIVESATDVSLHDFEIVGDRVGMQAPWHLPTSEQAFADFYPANGVLVRQSSRIRIRSVRISRIRTFPVLVNASQDVTVQSVNIEDSGTLNPAGRNNTTGGILLEEGVSRFEIAGVSISRITGNAIWTHSWARSPRQKDGLIRDNTIAEVGRDAIQVGHAVNVRVTANHGSRIGFPTEWVDVENHGVGVALDTAGNVENSTYTGNRFTDVNGQCIDLDGFHDGRVEDNSCLNEKPLETYPASHYGVVFGNNDPGMKPDNIILRANVLRGFAYGAVFVVGSGHRLEDNRFEDVNRAHCGATPLTARCNYAVQEQPDLLRSGIYLAANGGRSAETRRNIIRGNVVTGYGMNDHCIAAGPGVTLSENQLGNNTCTQ